MLRNPCNITETFPSSPQFPLLSPQKRHKNVSILCTSKRENLSMSIIKIKENENGSTRKRNGWVNELRMGKMGEDGLSYKESLIIRCHEVGINKTATLEALANFLQEVGCNHAQSVGFSDGFGTTPTMRKLHLIWVTARMHIEIDRFPAWRDVVEVETWCQAEGRLWTRRDFILKDYANGEVIGRATSKWVIMNMDTRKLERVTPQIADEILLFSPKKLRLVFPEENSKSLQKIPKLADPGHYSKLGLVPRRADLDMNQHVNNVTYIGWVLESMPQDIIDTHELRSITLDYRRECQHDDVVDSLTSSVATNETPSMSPLNGINGALSPPSYKDGDDAEFLHLLKLSSDGSEINRGHTEWRRKPQR